MAEKCPLQSIKVFRQTTDEPSKEWTCLTDRKIEEIFKLLNETNVEIKTLQDQMQQLQEQPSQKTRPRTHNFEETDINPNDQETPSTQVKEHGPISPPISEDLIYRIGEGLAAEDWKKLAAVLGVSGAKVSHIDAENRDTAEKGVQVLRRWRQKEGSRATVELLMVALNKIKRRDLIEAVRGVPDSDTSEALPPEVSEIMTCFLACLEEWRNSREKEKGLLKEIENLTKELERVHSSELIRDLKQGPKKDSVALSCCGIQAMVLRDIFQKLDEMTEELLEYDQGDVVENVFHFMESMKDECKHLDERVEELEKRKPGLAEADQEEVDGLKKKCAERCTDLEQATQRFEARWKQQWAQLRRQRTRSEPPMSKEKIAVKVRREHTVHAVTSSDGRERGAYRRASPPDRNLQIFLRYLKEAHSAMSKGK